MSAQAVGGHRLHPPAQPDLADHRGSSGLRDLVARLPARRHQPARHPAALRRRLHRQLRARLQDRLAEPPAPLQRRDLPARLDEYPILLPRRQRPHRDPERRQRPHPRRRVRLFARPAEGLTFSLGGAYNDAETTNTTPLAPAGTRLPLTARFKGNARMRYEFPVGGGWQGHVQLSACARGQPDARPAGPTSSAIYGSLRSYQPGRPQHRRRERRLVGGAVRPQHLRRPRRARAARSSATSSVCGDPGGATAIGPKIYTFVATPRTIGVRIGRRF